MLGLLHGGILCLQFAIAVFSGVFRQQFSRLLIVERVTQLVIAVIMSHCLYRVRLAKGLIESSASRTLIENIVLSRKDGKGLIVIPHGSGIILLLVH